MCHNEQSWRDISKIQNNGATIFKTKHLVATFFDHEESYGAISQNRKVLRRDFLQGAVLPRCMFTCHVASAQSWRLEEPAAASKGRQKVSRFT